MGSGSILEVGGRQTAKKTAAWKLLTGNKAKGIVASERQLKGFVYYSVI